MRPFSALILIVVLFACVGWYRGWFHVASNNSTDKPAITASVDKEKIQQDKDSVQDKLQELKK